jgi:hypothetical protein
MEALAGLSVARDGLLSPSGSFALLAPICFAFFMLAAGVWLLRSASARAGTAAGTPHAAQVEVAGMEKSGG